MGGATPRAAPPPDSPAALDDRLKSRDNEGVRRLLLTGLALLCACAEGGRLPPRLSDRGEGGLSFRDGPGPGGEKQSPEAAPPLLDGDKDGHCAAGSVDPGGICKSLNDCDDGDATRYPGAAETCANAAVDNDCDGESKDVDEDQDGKDDLGVACATGLPGVCADGKRQCQDGKLACAPGVAPGAVKESCDGADNDCNGKVDDGQVCAAGMTCAGSQGCRCGSGPACTGSKHCCSGSCLDVSASTANCGGCGVACGAGESCASEACSCGTVVGTKGGGPACQGGTSCVSGLCQTCNPTTNLAPQATASSSGGGSAADYLPAQMNNGLLEASCKFHWVSAGSSAGGDWIQYTWPKDVTIGSLWFDTVPATSGVCSTTAGRTLAGGKVQIWTGTAWSTVTTVSSKSNDWSVSFAPVTTSKLRLYDLVATTSGFASNPIIFEWRVFCQ